MLLQVKDVSPGASAALLREDRLDLALTLDLRAVPGDGVEVFDLFTDPVQLALHRGHRLAGHKELRLADLAGETWIDVPRANSGGNLLVRACEHAGFVPEIAFESDDYAVIGELVRSGVGIALLPTSLGGPTLTSCSSHSARTRRGAGSRRRRAPRASAPRRPR